MRPSRTLALAACSCALLLLLGSTFVRQRDPLSRATLFQPRDGQTVALRSVLNGKYLEVSTQDGMMYAAASSHAKRTTRFRVMLLSKPMVEMLADAMRTANSAEWARRKAVTASGCRCSGYLNDHGFGSYCYPWEHESQDPWCYVADDCESNSARGSFGRKFDVCTSLYPDGASDAEMDEGRPPSSQEEPLRSSSSTSYEDGGQGRGGGGGGGGGEGRGVSGEGEDSDRQVLRWQEEQYILAEGLERDASGCDCEAYCVAGGWQRGGDAAAGAIEARSNDEVQSADAHAGVALVPRLTPRSGCACSNYSNAHGFGAYCAAWEFETQTPWCYVRPSCAARNTAGSFGQPYEDCAPVDEAAAQLRATHGVEHGQPQGEEQPQSQVVAPLLSPPPLPSVSSPPPPPPSATSVTANGGSASGTSQLHAILPDLNLDAWKHASQSASASKLDAAAEQPIDAAALPARLHSDTRSMVTAPQASTPTTLSQQSVSLQAGASGPDGPSEHTIQSTASSSTQQPPSDGHAHSNQTASHVLHTTASKEPPPAATTLPATDDTTWTKRQKADTVQAVQLSLGQKSGSAATHSPLQPGVSAVATQPASAQAPSQSEHSDAATSAHETSVASILFQPTPETSVASAGTPTSAALFQPSSPAPAATAASATLTALTALTAPPLQLTVASTDVAATARRAPSTANASVDAHAHETRATATRAASAVSPAVASAVASTATTANAASASAPTATENATSSASEALSRVSLAQESAATPTATLPATLPSAADVRDSRSLGAASTPTPATELDTNVARARSVARTDAPDSTHGVTPATPSSDATTSIADTFSTDAERVANASGPRKLPAGQPAGQLAEQPAGQPAGQPAQQQPMQQPTQDQTKDPIAVQLPASRALSSQPAPTSADQPPTSNLLSAAAPLNTARASPLNESAAQEDGVDTISRHRVASSAAGPGFARPFQREAASRQPSAGDAPTPTTPTTPTTLTADAQTGPSSVLAVRPTALSLAPASTTASEHAYAADPAVAASSGGSSHDGETPTREHAFPIPGRLQGQPLHAASTAQQGPAAAAIAAQAAPAAAAAATSSPSERAGVGGNGLTQHTLPHGVSAAPTAHFGAANAADAAAQPSKSALMTDALAPLPRLASAAEMKPAAATEAVAAATQGAAGFAKRTAAPSLVHASEASLAQSSDARARSSSHADTARRRLAKVGRRLLMGDETGAQAAGTSPLAALGVTSQAYSAKQQWVVLRSLETNTFVSVEPPPHAQAMLAHGKADSISLSNIFGFLRGGFLWSRATDSLLNVCSQEDGRVCTGYLESEADVHYKRLQHPLLSSVFEVELVNEFV